MEQGSGEGGPWSWFLQLGTCVLASSFSLLRRGHDLDDEQRTTAPVEQLILPVPRVWKISLRKSLLKPRAEWIASNTIPRLPFAAMMETSSVAATSRLDRT